MPDTIQNLASKAQLLNAYLQLFTEDKLLLSSALTSEFKELVCIIETIKYYKKTSVKDLAKALSRSEPYIRSVVSGLVQGGFPIYFSEDNNEEINSPNRPGRKRKLIELQEPERDEYLRERVREGSLIELDSEIEQWVDEESLRLSLTRSEFVNAAMQMMRSQQNNEMAENLSRKYTREANVESLIF